MILPGFPVSRPRRLRQSPTLRRLVAETHLHTSQLVLPLFARFGRKLRREIDAMPGVCQLSPDESRPRGRQSPRGRRAGGPALRHSGQEGRQGFRRPMPKRHRPADRPVVEKELPELLVITDVCLCEYMEHGHCGIVSGGKS